MRDNVRKEAETGKRQNADAEAGRITSALVFP